MKPPFLPWKLDPVGVEVSDTAFRLAQRLFADRVEEVEVPRVPGEAGPYGWPGDAESRRLAAVVARRRFRGRRLVLSVPMDACRYAEVEVPAGSGDAATEAVRLAGAAAGMDAATSVLAASPVGGGVGVRRFLVRGCAAAPLEVACATLAEAGLRVAGVVARADALAAASGPAAAAWLDLGSGSGSDRAAATRAVLVVAEAGRPAYVRPLRATLPARLDAVSPAARERLAAEVSPGLRQALDRCAGDAVTRLRIAAANAAGPAAAALGVTLGERLGLREPAPASDLPARNVVQALAGAARPAADLLPVAVRAARRERTTCRAVLGAAAGYAALAAVLLALLVSGRPDTADAAAPDRLAALEAAAATRTRGLGLELKATQARAEALQSAAAAAEATADRPDWRRLLDRLAADAGTHVRFREVEVQPATGAEAGGAVAIRVAGEAPDPGAAWQFALALERGELFDRVDLARTRRSARPSIAGEAGVMFQIDLRLLPLKAEATIGKEGSR